MKKYLSLLMTLCLLFTALPVAALAEGDEHDGHTGHTEHTELCEHAEHGGAPSGDVPPKIFRAVRAA